MDPTTPFFATRSRQARRSCTKVRDELDAIKRAVTVARVLNKEDFEFSSHRSIIDEIVGKGYGRGHTDSGERLLRMHVKEVVAWPT